MIDQQALLARRLARYREAIHRPADGPARPIPARSVEPASAIRLARAVGGEVRTMAGGSVVLCPSPARPIPLDRVRLANLPGQPPPGVPLLCLDTETTGLATAAGTVAFLVGIGWWEGDSFHQVQLFLPDHADESALLTMLADLIPPDAWLVTYNGRAFDWPLLVARYRLHGSPAPAHAGHLDLLPIVRRLFRHRLPDARLRTVEEHLLAIERHGDVEGWEIPGRYLGFLHGASAEPLAEVARHNDQDVRSMARLIAHLDRGLGDRRTWAVGHPGDLAGLGRSLAREGRLSEALECLDLAVGLPTPPARRAVTPPVMPADDWWSPTRTPDYGARVVDRERLPRPIPDAPWTPERLAVERARLQRRAGDPAAAADSWTSLMAHPGRTGIVAAIELAKLLEHQVRDLGRAMNVVSAGLGQADRRRRLGRPEPDLERDLRRRAERLRRRLARDDRASVRRPAVGQVTSSVPTT